MSYKMANIPLFYSIFNIKIKEFSLNKYIQNDIIRVKFIIYKMLI